MRADATITHRIEGVETNIAASNVMKGRNKNIFSRAISMMTAVHPKAMSGVNDLKAYLQQDIIEEDVLTF